MNLVGMLCFMSAVISVDRVQTLDIRDNGKLSVVQPEDMDLEDEEELLSSIKQRPIRPQSNSRISPVQMAGLAPRYNRKPGKKQMKLDYLKTLLGNDYNPERMSIDPPLNRSDTVTTQDDSSWVSRRLNQQLALIDFPKELSDDQLQQSQLDQPTVDAMKRFFLRKSFCPVRFTWEDVGQLFWPRWLRLGECEDKNSECSWPPGMHCVPVVSTTVRLLRWHCKPVGGKRRKAVGSARLPDRRSRQAKEKRRLKCEWLKVPYPITTECYCTC